MSRYIDAEKLCELAKNYINKSVDCNDIMRFPLADVQEVIHAKFELIDNGKGVCSNCHRLDSIDNIAKYCRYCGARMDGDKR